MAEGMYTQNQVQQMMLMMRNVMASPVEPVKLDSGITANPSDSSKEEEDKPMSVTLMVNGTQMTINGNDASELIQRALKMNQAPQAPKAVRQVQPEPMIVQAVSKPEEEEVEVWNETPRIAVPLFRYYANKFLKTFLIGKVSGSYIKEAKGFLKNHIIPVIGDSRLDEITTADIQRILDGAVNTRTSPPEPLCVKTKKGILIMVTSILEAAKEDGLIERNPAKSRRLMLRGKEPRIVPSWEEEEWAKLYSEVLPKLKHQPERLFLLIDMFHGLRKGEIAALTWDDIDLEAGYMYVKQSVQWSTDRGASNQGRLKAPKTKNGVRCIKLSKYVLPYLREADKSKPFLIHGVRYPTNKGIKPPSMNTVAAVINRISQACKECGLRTYRSHEIRHTVVTLDCEAKIDDKTLANNHGHYTADFSKKQYARSLMTQRERARIMSDNFMGQILADQHTVRCLQGGEEDFGGL